ncbi:fungal-specific transcription factor domain-containing protein [Aspergillus egyptiacus]|nr:fungal-specific transcription factor domain-containing protein [Aspergillus egyptiacus]
MSARPGAVSHSRRQRTSQTSEDQVSAARNPTRTVTKTYRRSRDGCYTCRLRRKKCDEVHPTCSSCGSLGVYCEYQKPSWWNSPQARTLQKERIKQKVREMKVVQKEVALQEYIKNVVPTAAAHDNPKPQEEIITFDPSTSYLPTPTSAPLVANTYDFSGGVGSSAFVPFVQDTPALLDPTPVQNPGFFMYNPLATPLVPTSASSVTTTMSTSSAATIATTSTSMTTPALQSEDWYQGFADPQPSATNALDMQSSDFPVGPLSFYLEAKLSSNNRERYLLHHFVDNVLRLVFPILDLHKQGSSRVREILRSLDSNKAYYHYCLSVSALHLKTVKRQRGQRVEKEIMDHRCTAVSELMMALYADNNHDKILDATLAMIFFHRSVGSVETDGLLDVPWYDHFTSVTNLVNKLGLAEINPFTITPFSVSLSSWIDILGATMMRKSPQFAHAYRIRHLNGISSGLRELMGCDDGIMYLISEIACLDRLKGEGLDDFTIYHHVTALTVQLDHAEQAVIDPTLENPMSATGIVQADKLTKNMTAIFRVAARIYLYSLLPDFRHDQQNVIDLVESVGNLLQYIPSGPMGFDRTLVWPMLITGAFSTPTSTFRAILDHRVKGLGESRDIGSFGRMYSVLQEVWKLSDETSEPMYTDPNLLPYASSNLGMPLPSQTIPTIGRPIKKQPIHWRDIMAVHGWRYLLL